MKLRDSRTRNAFSPNKLTPVILSGLFLPSAAFTTLPVFAQDTEDTNNNDKNRVIEEVVVQGIRKTVQNSIDIKRDATTIVDGLSVDDIGDLPALSIGEAIETITGASSHRDQGGATEISIRGLGPFLGSTVINGREATNGSGDRSVNFSQFPSELFNAIKVYKTQEASLIEGGVSAQIALETVKPLDFGKQRVQFDVKGNWNPDNSDIDGNERDIGSRTTFSYIDQFDFGDFGDVGISIGVQSNLATNPEQEARSSSTFLDCRFDPASDSGIFDTGNCDGGDGGLDLNIDPETGVAPDEGVPFAFTSSSRSFRQNITDDERESFFAAIQWQPNDKLEINTDFQYSDREFSEIRNDLVFAENRRIDSPDVSLDDRLPVDLVVLDDGTLVSFTNEQRIETLSSFQERLEEYIGGGIELDYKVNDALSVSFDISYSDTERQENIIQTRLQSEPTDIFGNDVPGAANNGRVETATEIGIIPTFTVQNFDVTNHDLFADAARTRVDLNQFRTNTIKAARGDFDYQISDSDFFTSVQGGIRVSELEFASVPRIRDEFTFDDEAIQAASLECRRSFPEDDFFSSLNGTNTLITNVDENGNVIAQGTGNSFATFDPVCLAREFIGEVPSIPDPRGDIANVDVEEKTTALYLQANYDSTFAGFPVRGNFGLRVVKTEVDSVGLRGALTAVIDDEGNLTGIVADEDESALTPVTGGSDYTEVLPSFNLVVDVHEDVIVRGGIFKALSRPDPADYGFGRTFSGLQGDSDGATSINEAVGLAVANGNPNLDPFTSWNFDVAVEWYPNDDTILAIGGYYKRFEGGFENTSQVEQFEVDGEILETVVTTQQVSDESTTITGIEVTASHAFTYLPGFLSGFGTKISYNYADSDFEFEDGQFGESTQIIGGEEIERVGIVNPANLTGFSQHVFSSQLYYQVGGFNASLNYKYRSEYFQQFNATPGNIRIIGDTGVWEARMSYRVNDNVKVSLEAINIFDEPRKNFNPTTNNVSEVNVYGARVFAGVQVRF